jgi:hypothetical protein
MSADYRLSAFGSILGGLTVSYAISPAMNANLGATIQSQHGRDRVIPVPKTAGMPPGPSISAADLTVGTITAGFTFHY